MHEVSSSHAYYELKILRDKIFMAILQLVKSAKIFNLRTFRLYNKWIGFDICCYCC